MIDVSFVIPFRSDGGHRERIFRWNISRLYCLFEDSEIIVADNDDDKFILSKARNKGIRQATRDVIINVDADTVWNPSTALEAVNQLKEGQPWCIPYKYYNAVDYDDTEKILTNTSSIYLSSNYNLERCAVAHPTEPYPPVSGLTVLWREDLYKIGGFDERFVNWGWEDTYFAFAANKILGQYWRSETACVYHLWHPRGGLEPTDPGAIDNRELYNKLIRRFDEHHEKFI